jgi:hypothetical protein
VEGHGEIVLPEPIKRRQSGYEEGDDADGHDGHGGDGQGDDGWRGGAPVEAEAESEVVMLVDAGVVMLVLLLMVAVLLVVDRLARPERQLSVGK